MDQNNQGQEAQPTTNTQKPDAPDQVIIIEEKVTGPNGTTSVRKYSKGKLLGKGGFAKCFEFTNLETQKVQAAKVIEKSTLNKNRAKQKLLSEIKIHKSLRHENIVSFEHVFEDSECVYILLEVCSNQTLSELIKRRKRLTEFEVQCYTVQMISALQHLRENRIIHRDLKLGNLFLDDKMQIKLADFGLAAKLEFDGEKRKTICGTPNYIAPEVLDGKTGHSYEVDIWSLGVIIYTLIIGRPPFETSDVKATYKKIKMLDYTFPETVQISDAARNLITKMLNLDPSRRPTLEDILDHPFIDNGGSIPKTLPVSTLACAPSLAYLSQYANGKAIGGEVNTLTVSRNPSNIGTIKLNDQTTTNFNNSTNPNNQAMAMTSNDLKLGTAKQSDNQAETETGLTVKTDYGKLRNEAYVRTWVDYSSKYGLGYVLSNGSTGVYFNDGTKIVFEPNQTYFEYIEKRKSDRVEEVNKHTLQSYPKELHKKVALLQHFQKYLENGKKPEPVELDEESKKNGLVFIKKWLKTKHAVMFRLNNKVVQVNFTDKTEIILSSDTKIVIYQNKQGKRSEYPLATALESTNVEMAKRLKYTKDILTTMLNGGGNQAKDSPQVDQETQKIEFQTAN